MLEGAPTGTDVPLVIQVGKWRRQIKVPSVASCQDTPLMDPQLTRLPRNKTEGDIPKLAIAVGSAEQVRAILPYTECRLLRPILSQHRHATLRWLAAHLLDLHVSIPGLVSETEP